MRSTPLAIIALGSNLGDSRRIVLEAMEHLQALSRRALLKSSLWQSSPVDCPPHSPPFINAVVGLVPCTGETPESLLTKLQELESRLGRQPKKILNEPRVLDLDLIAFGSETRATKELTLPHPRAHKRHFVLLPLKEIAPDFMLAGQTMTAAELLEGLAPDPGMKKAAPFEG
jgi:2-amino-4-hydroxy-6-hydroxymethyldihydropteridine diphosphokinase